MGNHIKRGNVRKRVNRVALKWMSDFFDQVLVFVATSEKYLKKNKKREKERRSKWLYNVKGTVVGIDWPLLEGIN